MNWMDLRAGALLPSEVDEVEGATAWQTATIHCGSIDRDRYIYA